MKRRLRLAGLTLSCLTVATVALAQQCPGANACGRPQTSAGSVLHAPPDRIEKARLTRPVEPRRVDAPVVVRIAITPPY